MFCKVQSVFQQNHFCTFLTEPFLMVFEEFHSYDPLSSEFTSGFQCSLPSVLCESLSKSEQNGAT